MRRNGIAISLLLILSTVTAQAEEIEVIPTDFSQPFKMVIAKADRPIGISCKVCDRSKISDADISFLVSEFKHLIKMYPNMMRTIANGRYNTIEIIPVDDESLAGGAVASVNPFIQKIQISSAFFRYTDIDEIGKFETRKATLIHELIHAIDNTQQLLNRFHRAKNLTRLLKYHYTDTSPGLPVEAIVKADIDEEIYLKISEEAQKILAEKGWAAARNYVRSKIILYGYPSMYAIKGGIKEAFAEFGSHIAVDPTAPEYMSREVIRFFKENVLN